MGKTSGAKSRRKETLLKHPLPTIPISPAVEANDSLLYRPVMAREYSAASNVASKSLLTDALLDGDKAVPELCV